MAFDICLLDESEIRGDGQRLGRITINDFTERFAAHHPDPRGDVGELPDLWRTELEKLVAGAAAVRLIHDPRFAWTIYREADTCFIQQHLMLDGPDSTISPRETLTEEGDRISEWNVPIDAISRFLSIKSPTPRTTQPDPGRSSA